MADSDSDPGYGSCSSSEDIESDGNETVEDPQEALDNLHVVEEDMTDHEINESILFPHISREEAILIELLLFLVAHQYFGLLLACIIMYMQLAYQYRYRIQVDEIPSQMSTAETDYFCLDRDAQVEGRLAHPVDEDIQLSSAIQVVEYNTSLAAEELRQYSHNNVVVLTNMLGTNHTACGEHPRRNEILTSNVHSHENIVDIDANNHVDSQHGRGIEIDSDLLPMDAMTRDIGFLGLIRSLADNNVSTDGSESDPDDDAEPEDRTAFTAELIRINIPIGGQSEEKPLVSTQQVTVQEALDTQQIVVGPSDKTVDGAIRSTNLINQKRVNDIESDASNLIGESN